MASTVPNEILFHIFEYLSIYDRLVARLVCKQWLSIINSPMLLNAPITFEKNSAEKREAVLSSGQKFSNFILNNTVIDKPWIDFFNTCSHQLYSLAIRRCEIENTVRTLADHKINDCVHLKNLEITHCDAWLLFNTNLNLDSLIIESNIDFTDKTVQELKRIILKIKKLYLKSELVHPIGLKRFYPSCDDHSYKHIVVFRPSQHIFSFPAYADFIETYAETLKHIQFIPTNIKEEITDISQIKNLKLETASFPQCNELCLYIPLFCQNQTHLTHLDLSNVFHLDDLTMTQICNSAPNLLVLILFSCLNLDSSIISVMQLKKLKKLDLGFCGNITNNSFQAAVKKAVCHNLVYLNLSHCEISNLTLSLILEFCNQKKKLEFLNLSKCSVTNTMLLTIFSYLELRHLKLKDSQCITDNGLLGKKEAESVPETMLSIRNLTKLKTLDLSLCLNITDNGLVESVQFPFLEILNLEGTAITQAVEDKIISQNPCLRKIRRGFGYERIIKKY